MKVESNQLRLYAVTDRRWLSQRSLAEDVEKSLKGGVTFLQLREKHLSEEAFLEEAIKIKKICKQYNVPLIINDNVEIALKSGADGVHVGQKDLEAGIVRQQIGADKILGVSARTVEQAILAERQGADYLGVGAVFSTSTKTDAQTIDHETLRAIRKAVSIPIVAIGGISKDNIHLLGGSGVDGVAVVSAIYAQEDIQGATVDLLARSEEMVKEK